MTWTLLIDPISRLLDKIIPDPEARDKAKIELLRAERQNDLEEMRLALQADQMQASVNQEEAKHASVFVAGWRPFIGWVCGVAFAYHFIVQPLLAFILANTTHQPPILPDFDMEMIGWVLGGMLGIGGMRTFEKLKGITR